MYADSVQRARDATDDLRYTGATAGLGHRQALAVRCSPALTLTPPLPPTPALPLTLPLTLALTLPLALCPSSLPPLQGEAEGVCGCGVGSGLLARRSPVAGWG